MRRPAASAVPAIAVAAVLGVAAVPSAADPPTVVADIPAVQSLVATVMGDLGTPVVLLDRGGDAHDFQLRPSQARALAEAGLVFWIGPELTPWLDRALEGTGAAGEAVALLHAEGTHRRVYGADAGHRHDDQGYADQGHDDQGHDGHGHDHAAGSVDPHAWLDPANAAAWAGVIAERLAAADPHNAAAYASNAAAAREALGALDAELRQTLAGAAGRPLYVFHDAYRYLAEAYGLTVAGTLAGGDAADPGAARLAELRAELAAAEGACLFAEVEHGAGAVQAVAEGSGAAVAVLDPAGVALEPGPGLYAALMRNLAGTIAGCRG
jgi:zinc transport system substrate-binding protein